MKIFSEREGANEKLSNEIMTLAGWCQELDMGRLPDGLQDFLKQPIEGSQNILKVNVGRKVIFVVMHLMKCVYKLL